LVLKYNGYSCPEKLYAKSARFGKQTGFFWEENFSGDKYKQK
jgi:hypothetical protein